jgi:hypothetical protein
LKGGRGKRKRKGKDDGKHGRDKDENFSQRMHHTDAKPRFQGACIHLRQAWPQERGLLALAAPASWSGTRGHVKVILVSQLFWLKLASSFESALEHLSGAT